MYKKYIVPGLLCMSLAFVVHAADMSATADSSLRQRPDFSGTWLLDKDSSDDLAAKMKEGRKILWASRSILKVRISDMRALVRGAEVLQLNHNDPLLLITADDGPQQQVFTDNRRATKSANGAVQQALTTIGWEADDLVVETIRDGGPRLVQRYRLNADTGKLEVSTEITPPGASAHVTIKRVYDRADTRAVANPDTQF